MNQLTSLEQINQKIYNNKLCKYWDRLNGVRIKGGNVIVKEQRASSTFSIEPQYSTNCLDTPLAIRKVS